MKIYLDDERPTPEGWVRVYTPEQAIWHLQAESMLEEVTCISLDNDLGLPLDAQGLPREGYRVAEWIEARVAADVNYAPPEILIHTGNPIARKKIQQTIQSIFRLIAARGTT